ncbi:GNAT family N-acetyltransferase [Dysgonomonas sp. 520]|nr:GNAT family N-acetyltransferase [Dysgonomonas sp. 520]
MENREITWLTLPFNKLDCKSLYQILRLRSEVFVVEQACVYQDVDGKDVKALHVLGYAGEELVAYCRLFRAGDYFDEPAIGRVVVSAAHRRFGYGHQLMDKAIEKLFHWAGESEIVISAQLYLKRFYEAHDFEQISDIYPEDGIPHIRMRREINKERIL